MSSYIHFTEEQKQRAAAVNLEEFLRCRGEKLLSSGREKRLASDHSVTVRGNEWYDHGQPINKTDLQALAELTHYMDEHYSFNITLQTLSTIACMSESKMKKLFKSVYNMSITEYIQRKRISVAEHMLIQTDLTIAEISRIVGYSNPSRLIEIFKRYYGFTPSKYRK